MKDYTLHELQIICCENACGECPINGFCVNNFKEKPYMWHVKFKERSIPKEGDERCFLMAYVAQNDRVLKQYIWAENQRQAVMQFHHISNGELIAITELEPEE